MNVIIIPEDNDPCLGEGMSLLGMELCRDVL